MKSAISLTIYKQRDIIGYALIAYVWLIFVALSFITQNEATLKQYDLTVAQLHAIQGLFSIPILFIWGTLLFAVMSFYRYSRQIAGSPDAAGFRYITWGLAILLVGTVTSSFLSQFSTLMSESVGDPTRVKHAFVIISNYVAVATAVSVYWFIFKGSRSLLESIKGDLKLRSNQLYRIVLPFVVLCAAYLVLVFTNPDRRVSSEPNLNPTFGLPDSLIFLTVALPYMAAWLFGMLAILGLYRYTDQTGGIIYKHLFKKLALGLTILISLTIVLQFLVQFASYWATAGLSALLGLVALIYLLLIVAHVQVANGARQLNIIETLAPPIFPQKSPVKKPRQASKRATNKKKSARR